MRPLLAATLTALAACASEGPAPAAAPPPPAAPDPRMHAALAEALRAGQAALEQARARHRAELAARIDATAALTLAPDEPAVVLPDDDDLPAITGGVVGGVVGGTLGGIDDPAPARPAVELRHQNALAGFPPDLIDDQSAALAAVVTACLDRDPALAAAIIRAGGVMLMVHIDHRGPAPRVIASTALGLGPCVRRDLRPLPAGGQYSASLRVR